MGRVPTADHGHSVAVSGDGKMAYVVNFSEGGRPDNSISVVDLAARKEVRRVDLGPLTYPHGMHCRERTNNPCGVCGRRLLIWQSVVSKRGIVGATSNTLALLRKVDFVRVQPLPKRRGTFIALKDLSTTFRTARPYLQSATRYLFR